MHQNLQTTIRRGFDERPFLLRMRFGYEGGRTGPLLFIGSINRSWRDYINGNLRATDLVTGTCWLGRGDTGRTLIRLRPEGGRGATASTLLDLNRALRGINAEAEFLTEGQGTAADAGIVVSEPRAVPPSPAESSGIPAQAAGSAMPAETAPVQPAPAEEPPVEGGDATATTADPNRLAKALREGFEAFKQSPTREALDGLKAQIEAFDAVIAAAPEHAGGKAHQFVQKLAALLDAKGAAFVASKGG